MANAARLGTRVDAGLLIGCVVLSLVTIVLREDEREPIASALRRTIVAPLVGLQRDAERWRVAYVTNDQREMAVDSVVLRTINAHALQVENEQLRGRIQELMDSVNQGLGSWESVKYFKLLPEDFSEASGELTPSLKVKRKVVQERHAEEIEALYREGAQHKPAARSH